MKTMKKLLSLLCLLWISAWAFGQDGQREAINTLLDDWHQAAANNDQEAYFECIDDAGIYIGTDSSEIWTRQQFYDWSAPHFNEEKGWAFRKKSRNIYLTDECEVAWFDELLEYGKGILRGSGVLVKRGDEWRIIHYVLSIPIPNDKYREVMTLINTKHMMSEDPEE
jgi:hypothetical protein